MENKGTLEIGKDERGTFFEGQAPVKVAGKMSYMACCMRLEELPKRPNDIQAGYEIYINGQPVGFAGWKTSNRTGALYATGHARNGMGAKYWFIFHPNLDDKGKLISLDVKNTDNSIDKDAQRQAAAHAAYQSQGGAFASA